MKILVTGGSGFIGTVLVGDLIEAGHEVVIYDKRPSERYPGLSCVADVRDQVRLTEAMRGCEAVYHLAAEHRDDVQPISLYHEVNVEGAGNLVAAAEKSGTPMIVFTSTVALYGLNVGIPDETFPAKPFNPYGASKNEAELLFKKWSDRNADRALVIVRPAVVFGEGNRGNVYNLLHQIVSGRFFMVGDGSNKKSMGYVRNVTCFLAKALELGPGIHVYNYADKPDLSTQELFETATRATGMNPSSLRIPFPLGLAAGFAFDAIAKIAGRSFPISSIRIKKFCANTQISTDKLHKLNFKAPYTLRDGLQRMIQSEFNSSKS